MALVTLAQLRSRAQTRADMVTSPFVSDAEWLEFINSSLTELWDLLTTVYEDYYFSSVDIALAAGQDTYNLPADFLKLRGVDLLLTADATNFVVLDRFDWAERERYQSTALGYVGLGQSLAYTTRGTSSIVFAPKPLGTQTVKVWYIPKAILLVADGDTVNGMNGWEEFIVVGAALKAIVKEESDPSALMAEKGALDQRIRSSASQSDATGNRVMSQPRTQRGDGGDSGGNGYY